MGYSDFHALFDSRGNWQTTNLDRFLEFSLFSFSEGYYFELFKGVYFLIFNF